MATSVFINFFKKGGGRVHMSATPVEVSREFGSLGAGVRAVCQEQNLGPLQERQAPLTTELPIQLLFRCLDAAQRGRAESMNRK